MFTCLLFKACYTSNFWGGRAGIRGNRLDTKSMWCDTIWEGIIKCVYYLKQKKLPRLLMM